ncbi:outer membrane lipoprotein-sorting protein [Trinickia sp. EG282A]|uniref:outer membrane lipoprotein-sorting protein n=1 Tax=Trinickia sp. EG282A TaxID=3237013 RepID=UPI0034D1534D
MKSTHPRRVPQVILTAFFATALAIAGTRAFADTPAQMLARADSYRTGSDDAQTRVRITNVIDGSQEDGTDYLVYARTNGDTLAITQTGENQGQKYLATDEGHWFYVPNTRRAVRINGLQRLQGEVVISDITRTHWAKTYSATVAGNAAAQIDGRDVMELDLAATDPDSVYPKVKLWVTSNGDVPVRAQFFLASGLLFRTADFGPLVDINGRKLIDKITYRNEIEKKRASVVQLSNGEARKLPVSWFNPDSLSNAN